MAISYQGERAAGVTILGAGTSQAITLATSCSPGNTLLLMFACRDTSTAGVSVSDAHSNAWTVDNGPLNQSNDFLMIASTRMGTGLLVAGDAVTITFGTAPSPLRMWMLEEIGGLQTTAGYVDQTAHAESASSATGNSGTTGVTTQADELVVTAYNRDNASGETPTRDATYGNWTTPTIDGGPDSGGFHKNLVSQFKIVAATGAQSSSITWTTPESYQGMIVTYKGVPASQVAGPAPRITSPMGG